MLACPLHSVCTYHSPQSNKQFFFLFFFCGRGQITVRWRQCFSVSQIHNSPIRYTLLPKCFPRCVSVQQTAASSLSSSQSQTHCFSFLFEICRPACHVVREKRRHWWELEERSWGKGMQSSFKWYFCRYTVLKVFLFKTIKMYFLSSPLLSYSLSVQSCGE